MTFSNELTQAQVERLALLIEECGEVIQAASKVLRHGYPSANPDKPPTYVGDNKWELGRELGHLLHAQDMVVNAGDVSIADVETGRIRKRETIGRWLHHQ